MKILLDTTIFVAHLLGKVSLQKLLTEDNKLFTTVNVLEETLRGNGNHGTVYGALSVPFSSGFTFLNR